MAFLYRQGTPFFVILSLSGTVPGFFELLKFLTSLATYDIVFLVCSRAFSSTRDRFSKYKARCIRMRNAITLACTDCKQRNYQTNKNKKNNPDRIEMMKYCKFCGKHTLHRETK